MIFDVEDLLKGVAPCLDELEYEYLGIGVEHCRGFEDHSQLSAFLMLGRFIRPGHPNPYSI